MEKQITNINEEEDLPVSIQKLIEIFKLIFRNIPFIIIEIIIGINMGTNEDWMAIFFVILIACFIYNIMIYKDKKKRKDVN